MLPKESIDKIENVLKRRRRNSIEDVGDMHIIPSDYLDNLLNQAVEYHKDKGSAMNHIFNRLMKHLPEPVSESLAETLTDSRNFEDEDELDDDKDVTFDLNMLKKLENDVIYTVFGYDHSVEYELLSLHGSNDYYTIPELIHQLILYYYNYMKPVELIPVCPICPNTSARETDDKNLDAAPTDND